MTKENEECGVYGSNGVSDSYGVCHSDGVFHSKGVYNSKGVSNSYGVFYSYGVFNSDGVYNSKGVYNSYGVSNSKGVRSSNGVFNSYGVFNSKGVFNSHGVRSSYGVRSSLFMSNYTPPHLLFNKEISNERYLVVRDDYLKACNGWTPKFNNAFILYKENGDKWNFNASKIKSLSIKEAWKDMPQTAIDYLRSLPEFDAKIFEEITGIKDNVYKIIIGDKEIELSKESYDSFKEQFKD